MTRAEHPALIRQRTASPWRAGLLVALLASLNVACASTAGAPRGSAPASGPSGYPRAGNAPHYVVFGQRYYVMASAAGYRERGVASWYGRKFHGRPTASGEIYDMHAMTAAHKSLPLPSYAQVTNLANGRSVVVRVNDRGPFVDNRLIDLSYAAARELDLIAAGTGLVEVKVITKAASASQAAPSAATTSTGQSAQASAGTAVGAIDLQPQLVPEQAVAVVLPPEQPSAETVAAKLLIDDTLSLPPSGGTVYVQLGAFSDPVNAETLRLRLQSYGFARAHTVGSNTQPAIFKVRIGPLPDVNAYDRLIERMARYDIKDSYLTVD